MGEGLCDESFLKHVKSIYVQRRCGLAVTVRNARGKGPCNVIETAVRANAGYGFDIRAVLVDRDLVDQMTPKVNGLVKSNSIKLLWSDPCLEGLLLDILGKYVPHASAQCKKLMKEYMPGPGTEVENYPLLFPKEVLDACRSRVSTIDLLLTLLEGR